MSNPELTATKSTHWNGGIKLFHWLIAGLIFCAIILAILAGHWDDLGGSRKQQYWLFMLHKSLGLTVLLLAVCRLLWRISHPRPPLLSSHSAIERKAAEGAHYALYGLLFVLPMSGWWLNSVAGIPLKYFLLVRVPAVAEATPALEDLAKSVHSALGVALFLILMVHIAGALKHHWFDKDATLQRMLPNAILGRLTGAVMICLVAGLITVVAIVELAEKNAAPADFRPEVLSDTEQLPVNWTTRDSSELTFDVNVSGEKVEGLFKRFTAIVNFDPDHLSSSSLSAVVYTESAFTDNSTRDEILPEADWFAVQQYPLAEFNTGSIRTTGDDSYVADATLRIRGTTRTINFPFRWQQTDDTATLTAIVTLNRLDFKLGADEFADDGTIAFTVPVRVLLELTR